MSVDSSHLYVEMPGGGAQIPLRTTEEVERWNTLEGKYRDQYDLRKINDETNLGTLLIQHINLLRAQLGLSGRVAEVDKDGLPTGRMEERILKPAEIKSFQVQIADASKEIREIEKIMGIDKKSRDQAGDEGVRSYLLTMKEKAHRYGLHISKRLTAYEEFVMELRWRYRLEQIGDAEDKHYEDCTLEGIAKWARAELERLEQTDRDFAGQEQAIVMGHRP